MTKNKQGFLISVEGIDGCGKSTLIKNLHKQLKKEGFDVLATKEPGKTKIGKEIKKILYQEKNSMCGQTEYLLFAADRAQHFHEIVIPSLNEGKIVLSDRMDDSSVVYQGYGFNFDIEILKKINSWAMNNIKPNLVFYIRLDEKTAFERIKQRKLEPTPFEKQDKEFWQHIINGFETTFKNRKNVVILDGKLSANELLDKAKNIVVNLIKNSV